MMNTNNHQVVVINGVKMTVVTKEGQTVDDVLAQLHENIEPDYIKQRVMAYPSIQEQLDMMYKDAIDGGTRWKDCISDVKSQYPKV